MVSTDNRDPRNTTASAAWPPDADVVTVRLCPAFVQPGDTITATIDEEHRRRMARRKLNHMLRGLP